MVRDGWVATAASTGNTSNVPRFISPDDVTSSSPTCPRGARHTLAKSRDPHEALAARDLDDDERAAVVADLNRAGGDARG